MVLRTVTVSLEETEKDTQRRPCEEARIRVTWPQGKECLESSEAGRGKEGFSP